MPPAPPDSSVGRARGPVGVARRIRRPRPFPPDPGRGLSTSSISLKSKGDGEGSALEALLVDLGSQVHRGSVLSPETTEAPRFCPTGLPAIDAELGGGFPSGRLSEICGAPSSGRTALAFSLLAETQQRGVLAAWIDLADAFDPSSAIAAGGDLERLLWVRARSEDEALRSCDRLLQTEGFELIILDCALSEALPGTLSEALPKRLSKPDPRTRSEAQDRRARGIRDVSWLRLARLAASTRTTLVALSNAPMTGSRAELVLEMRALKTRFLDPPSLLDGLETTAVPKRHRSRPIGRAIPLSIHADPLDPEPQPEPPPEPPDEASAADASSPVRTRRR